MKNKIKEFLLEAKSTIECMIQNEDLIDAIELASDMLVESIRNGGKIITCGNGGSMCDAMHFAEELSGRFREDRIPLPALAISDVGHMTCVSNDYGYEHVFSRYLEGLGRQGDVLIAISTSGNSSSIIEAAKIAGELDIKTIALVGKAECLLANYADIIINVSETSRYADRIQECHIKIIHILIGLIEQKLGLNDGMVKQNG